MRKLTAACLFALFASAAYSAQLTVAWQNGDNATNATGTVVYWGVASGTYTNQIVVPITQTNLVITNLVAGQRYWLAAKHTDGTDYSDYSNEVMGKTKMNPPRNCYILVN